MGITSKVVIKFIPFSCYPGNGGTSSHVMASQVVSKNGFKACEMTRKFNSCLPRTCVPITLDLMFIPGLNLYFNEST